MESIVAILTGHPLHSVETDLRDEGYALIQRRPLMGTTPEGEAFRVFSADTIKIDSFVGFKIKRVEVRGYVPPPLIEAVEDRVRA